MSRHRARKRFGQHFLTDPGVIGDIVQAQRVNRRNVAGDLVDEETELYRF